MSTYFNSMTSVFAECFLYKIFSLSKIAEEQLRRCLGCDHTSLEKNLSLFKGNKNEIIPFALLYIKFCSAIEKCYYHSILLKM